MMMVDRLFFLFIFFYWLDDVIVDFFLLIVDCLIGMAGLQEIVNLGFHSSWR